MLAASDTACTIGSFRVARTSCFGASGPCASCMAASGIGTPAAPTPIPRPLARSSGGRSSRPTSNAIGGTDSICSIWAGGSQSSGNAHCERGVSPKRPWSWTTGCGGTLGGSRRVPRAGRRPGKAEPPSPDGRFASPIRRPTPVIAKPDASGESGGAQQGASGVPERGLPRRASGTGMAGNRSKSGGQNNPTVVRRATPRRPFRRGPDRPRLPSRRRRSGEGRGRRRSGSSAPTAAPDSPSPEAPAPSGAARGW